MSSACTLPSRPALLKTAVSTAESSRSLPITPLKPARRILPPRTCRILHDHCRGSAALGKTSQVVLMQGSAQLPDVPVLDRVAERAMAIDCLAEADPLPLDLGSHQRAHLAVQHAPQILEPAAARGLQQQLMETGVTCHQGIRVVRRGGRGHLLPGCLQRADQVRALVTEA